MRQIRQLSGTPINLTYGQIVTARHTELAGLTTFQPMLMGMNYFSHKTLK